MSDHPIDPREVLISLTTAALTAAEADAAACAQSLRPDAGLIFRPEWRPTPRARSSTSQPLGRIDRPGHPLSEIKGLVPGFSKINFSSHPGRMQNDAVAELVKNQDVFDEVLNHPFPQALRKGIASLGGFRYYMIQDKLYLETCARLKMNAVAASPTFADVETFEFRHKSSLEYVTKLKETCSSMLERLMDDPSTVKNVVYHPAWTVVNYDSSSAGKYIIHLETHPTLSVSGSESWPLGPYLILEGSVAWNLNLIRSMSGAVSAVPT
ncbi:hypothetical protein K438DRAFT_1788813 [Mycena galopus ATCC 62051]|nr:hypothetical protein K438DRAFT_1788813 [Mycena galopus ATCC 62051]